MFTKSALLSLLAHCATYVTALPKASNQQLWQPAVGSPWQIIIKNNISVALDQTLQPSNVNIWDIDLFNTPVDIIQGLHDQKKKVICYFSAGSGEDWRPDYASIPTADLGEDLGCWPGEKWLNIRSAGVWSVMQKRIALAASKGCDAIDPDNMDGYSNGGGGFGLTQEDTINYVTKISTEAAKYGMSTGLKNAEEVLGTVMPYIQFAVNEQCASGGDCSSYNSLLAAGKPVFHIEYADHTISKSGSVSLSSNTPGLAGLTTEELRSMFCLENSDKSHKVGSKPRSKEYGSGLSTVTKGLLLDGFVYYCDKEWATSETMDVGTGGPSSGYCDDSKNKKPH